jgi:hypothetical protein
MAGEHDARGFAAAAARIDRQAARDECELAQRHACAEADRDGRDRKRRYALEGASADGDSRAAVGASRRAGAETSLRARCRTRESKASREGASAPESEAGSAEEEVPVAEVSPRLPS